MKNTSTYLLFNYQLKNIKKSVTKLNNIFKNYNFLLCSNIYSKLFKTINYNNKFFKNFYFSIFNLLTFSFYLKNNSKFLQLFNKKLNFVLNFLKEKDKIAINNKQIDFLPILRKNYILNLIFLYFIKKTFLKFIIKKNKHYLANSFIYKVFTTKSIIQKKIHQNSKGQISPIRKRFSHLNLIIAIKKI